MKQDFIIINNTLNQRGIVAVCRDMYMQPKRRGVNYFAKSPASADRTWSLCLYPSSNRYCDFANANHNGDIVGFMAYIKNINQWQALKELESYYGLIGAKETDKQDAQRRIRIQQEQERRKEERKQTFYAALWSQIDRLEQCAVNYHTAISKQLYEPFADEWAYCLNELQKTEYKLDILTGADCKTYRRLKPYSQDLSSDYYQWLLDCLAVLQEDGAFQATPKEIKELKTQAAYRTLGA